MSHDGGGSSGGGSSREYCLRWNNHQPNMVSFLSSLLPKESFADVTLVSAEGTKIQAHRIILSACSPYFEGVFESNPCKHPVVILKDVQYVDLRAIVSFIYNGEVNIEVDRINEIIQTATTLQVKGLAEVPAEEFKRVSLAARSSSPADSSPSVPVARTQPPPPLIMSASAVRSWNSTAETSENLNEFPVRKKLKKSASANIPFSSGSSSTNGDVTNSSGSSFESGVGTSVSRSMDEGIGSDISSNEQLQSSIRPGPPPLTAANAHLPKSRSLDDGYQRKNAANAEGALDATGYADHSGMDDNGLGQDGGYDDLDAVEGLKIEGVHSVTYVDGHDDEEEPVDMYFDEDPNTTGDYEEDTFNATGNGGTNVKTSPASFERPHVPLRKLLPKVKINKQNNNNNNNAARPILGVGHSLSLYRQQPPIRNFTSRALIGKRRRGRPLLRQPRIKRPDHESSSPGRGRDDGGGGGGPEEQGYSSDTGEPYPRPSSSSCFDPQQQQHHNQARSASVDHDISVVNTTLSSNPPVPSQKPTVPIVRVSQCSPTPPGSPQHVPSPKSEPGSAPESTSHSHHHSLLQASSIVSSSSVASVNSSGTSTLLTVPTVGDPVSPNITVRLPGSQGYLVKQISTPPFPSQYHSSEDESSAKSSHANPVIRRQNSQPNPLSSPSSGAYPSYIHVGKGQLIHILKSGDDYPRDEDSAAYFIEQPVPAGGADTSNILKEEPPSRGHGMSITLKDVGPSRSLTEGERPHYPQQQFATTRDSSSSTDLTSMGSLADGQLVHRSGHCPVLRPGPALGCNFCWNSVDSCEYHEKSDKKRKPRAMKLGLNAKPSSM